MFSMADRLEASSECVKTTDSVEKPLNRPLVEKWFRRCDSLV
jgi:hypothetical protein